MKHLLFITAIFLLTVNAQAQNTGIGTTTPQATLDVKGNQRIGGVNAFMTYDTIGGRIQWINSSLYAPVSQALMTHSAAADGLFYNNTAPISGQLEYRNITGAPVFYTNFINGNGYFAGNLGIGAATPQAKLHIISTGNEVARLDAVEPYLSLYSNGVYKGYFWKSPNSIELGSASGSGLPITLAPDGNQRVFVTPAGNVGIGTDNPGARLHVVSGASGYVGSNFPGITLEGSSNTYFNILSPNGNETAILFGKASDAASGGIVYNNAAHLNGMEFRTNGNSTRMVLLDNGRLGVGVSDPAYQLDISNRMRIRSGGNNSVSAGLWLNNNANNETAFIGMEDDTHVGLYGNGGAGWKFSMNTQTGALKINGTEGAAGQILQSNGASSPTWVTPVKYYEGSDNPGFSLTFNGAEATLSNATVTLVQNSIVEVYSTVGINAFSNTAGVRLIITDSYGSHIVAADPNAYDITTLGFLYRIHIVNSPGNYTFTLIVRKVAGVGIVTSATGYTPGYGTPDGKITVKVIPD